MAKSSMVWEVRAPEMDLAELVYFPRPVSEREARVKVRRIWAMRRLPSGTELWPRESKHGDWKVFRFVEGGL